MKISKKIGNQAEDKAVEYLLENGYSIIARNFYSHFGEIDIIAIKDEILHFIEVKYSKNTLPTERITSSKLQKILKTVQFYMYKNQEESEYQIDAIFMSDFEIQMIPNITIFG